MIGPAARRSFGFEVPTLPAVASRLLGAYASEDLRLSEVVELIEGDPGISSRLLRLANSAYYGHPRQVCTLERAVWLLGRATVAGVALAATLFRQLGDRLPPEAEALWSDSYRAGMGCRFLARRLPPSSWRSPPDALFLTGLLHDVGMLLSLAQEPEAYLNLLRTVRTVPELLEAERRTLGQDHAALAGEAMEVWNFPAGITAVCRHHHGARVRAELLPDWEVLCAVDCAISGEEPAHSFSTVGEGLRQDLADYLERARPQAENFCRALA